MPEVNLKDIRKEVLAEWQAYADASGLPLEYLIIEAVTFSVRSDRLGILHAKYLNERRKRKLNGANNSPAKEPDSVSTTPNTPNDAETLPEVDNTNNNYLNQNVDPSASSSEELEDSIPSHL
jgi:hypothetical protein